MADETKTVLLKVEIDQQAALTNLQDTNAKISGLKSLVTELNKEYKDGKLSQDEYSKAKTDLDLKIQQETKSRQILTQVVQAENNSLGAQKALLKDLQDQRDKVDRSTVEGAAKFQSLTGRIKELNDSMMNVKKESGGLTEQFLKFAESAKVGEFELGKIAGLLPLVASPALAAGAAISALGAAYANSAAGAKDLEEAQSRLSNDWSIISNILGGASKGEGEGLVDTTFRWAQAFGLATVAIVTGSVELSEALDEAMQKAQESANKLVDLKFEDIQTQKVLNQLSLEAQEQRGLVSTADTGEGKLSAANQYVELLKERMQIEKTMQVNDAQAFLQHQKDIGNDILSEKNRTQEALQYRQMLANIVLTQAQNQKQLNRALKVQERITGEVEKQRSLEKKNFDTTGVTTPKSSGVLNTNAPTGGTGDLDVFKNINHTQAANLAKKASNKDYTDAYIEYTKQRQESRKLEDENVIVSGKIQKQIDEDKKKSAEASVRALAGIGHLASNILGQNSEEYKEFATAQALISTYYAAQRAYESQFLPIPDFTSPERGTLAAIGAVAEGLANVAAINKIKFSDGGYTGDGGKYQPAGIVHAGEYVIPKESVQAYGISHFEKYMPGYADGGLVTGQMSTSVNAELMMSNAFKNMPQPIVSWKEGLLMNDRVTWKEGLITR